MCPAMNTDASYRALRTLLPGTGFTRVQLPLLFAVSVRTSPQSQNCKHSHGVAALATDAAFSPVTTAKKITEPFVGA